MIATAALRPTHTIEPDKLAAAERGDIARSVVATGKIEPLTKVEVKSKASGIVEKIYLDAGDKVKDGPGARRSGQRTTAGQRGGVPGESGSGAGRAAGCRSFLPKKHGGRGGPGRAVPEKRRGSGARSLQAGADRAECDAGCGKKLSARTEPAIVRGARRADEQGAGGTIESASGAGEGGARQRRGKSPVLDDHQPDERSGAIEGCGSGRCGQLDSGARLAGDAGDDAGRHERSVRAGQGGRGRRRQSVSGAERANRGRVVQGQEIRRKSDQDRAAGSGKRQRDDVRGARLHSESRAANSAPT